MLLNGGSMAETEMENSESIPGFSILRGVLCTLLLGAVGFVIPFVMIFFLLLYQSWTEDYYYKGFIYDELSRRFNDMLLGALWLSSMFGASAMSSFSFEPSIKIRRNFILIAGAAVVSYWVHLALDGPRYRGVPRLGKEWTDFTVLIAPSFLVGLCLMIHQIVRRNRIPSG